jgi:hypothetical protein
MSGDPDIPGIHPRPTKEQQISTATTSGVLVPNTALESPSSSSDEASPSWQSSAIASPVPHTASLRAPSYGALALHATWQSVSVVASWVMQGFVGLHGLFVTPEYDKTNVTEAIAKLQTTLVFLDQKMEAMNTNIDKYTSEARRLYAKRNRTAAIHQLRLKKMYEREVMKMDSLKFNLESNILHMESVGVMMETVSTIKDTSHQFQVVSKHVDFTKLEDTIEEMFEQRDTSRDIESILQGMHDSHEFDEEELLEELKQLSEAGSPAPAPAPAPAPVAESTTGLTSSLVQPNATTTLAHHCFPDAPTHPPTCEPELEQSASVEPITSSVP